MSAQIIDVQTKGNVVRFVLGPVGLEQWGGPDWSRAPYQNNAGPVDPSFQTGIHDVAFDFDDRVVEPWHDPREEFSKDDFRTRAVPALVIIRASIIVHTASYRQLIDIRRPGVFHVYFGDPEESIAKMTR